MHVNFYIALEKNRVFFHYVLIINYILKLMKRSILLRFLLHYKAFVFGIQEAAIIDLDALLLMFY